MRRSRRWIRVDGSWLGPEVRILPSGLELIEELAEEFSCQVRRFTDSLRRTSSLRIEFGDLSEDFEQRFAMEARRLLDDRFIERPEWNGLPMWAEQAGEAGQMVLQGCRMLLSGKKKEASALFHMASGLDPELTADVIAWMEEAHPGLVDPDLADMAELWWEEGHERKDDREEE